MGGLDHDHMHVGATYAERADAGCSDLMAFAPATRLTGDHKRGPHITQCLAWLVAVGRRRDNPQTHGIDGLDQAADAGGTIGMA